MKPADWKHIQGLSLADPNYMNPSKIDIILGADIVCNLFSSNNIKGPSGSPTAFNTPLGWVLMGSVNNSLQPSCSVFNVNCCSVTNHCLYSDLKRFWDIEEYSTPILSPEDEA